MALTAYQRRNMFMRRQRTGTTIAEQAALSGDLTLMLDFVDAGVLPERLLEMASRSGDFNKVRSLFAKGVAIDHPFKDDGTVLMHAATNGRLDWVVALIEAGANVNHEDVHGDSALIKATRGRYTAIITHLLEHGASPNPKKKVGPCALDVAVHYVSKHDFHRSSVEISRMEGVLEQLLNAGANPNHETDGRSRSTPFQGMLVSGHPQWKVFCHRMLHLGADLEHETEDGTTPLTEVLWRGNAPALRWLIQQGVDVNHTVKGEPSPLYLAMNSRHQNIMDDLVEPLLQAGADPFGPPHPQHPTDVPFVQLLKEIRRVKNLEGLENLSWSHEKVWTTWIQAPGFDMERANEQGRTPLLLAIEQDEHLAVQRLLRDGANIHHRDHQGFGALEVFFSPPSGRSLDQQDGLFRTLWNAGARPLNALKTLTDAVRHKATLSVLQTLWEVNPSGINDLVNGSTVLHIAAHHGSMEVVEWLLTKGANSSAIDDQGQRPDEIAAQRFNTDARKVVRRLLADHEERLLHRVAHDPEQTAPTNRSRL